MKKLIKKYGALITLLCLIIFPKDAIAGACEGLRLWYTTLVPTLFPFLLCTGILMNSGGFQSVKRIMEKFLCPLFGMSASGLFLFFTSLLCGYPMMAHVFHEQGSHSDIQLTEGKYLLSHSTLPSPMYLFGFVLPMIDPKMQVFFLLSIYLPVFLSLFLFRFKKSWRKKAKVNQGLNPSSGQAILVERKKYSFVEILEKSIASSVNTMLTIGILVMMFSILLQLLHYLFLPDALGYPLLCGLLELSCGVTRLSQCFRGVTLGILFCFFLSFGGLCVYAQTISKLKEEKNWEGSIFFGKVLQGLCSALLFYLFTR